MGPTHPHRSTAPPLGSIGFVVLLLLWAIAPSLLAQEAGGELVETYEQSLNKPFPDSFTRYFPLDEEGNELWLVPVSRIQANLTQQEVAIPIPPDRLSEVMAQLSRVAERLDRKLCSISPAAFNRRLADPKNPISTPLLELLTAHKIVLLGTVEHITPAWDLSNKVVVSIVFVRVEEVMKDTSGTLTQGQLVSYVRRWGEATILGIPLCTDPPPGVSADRAPREGDQVVLTGTRDLRNPGHLISHHTRVFPVIEGVVLPPEGAIGLSDDTATLAEVREKLR